MVAFEWDPAKAASNLRKHNVSFELAATVFQDPFMKSIVDRDHSEFEERWITIGLTRHGRLLVVSHTSVQTSSDETAVRLISARPATRNERRQFELGE
jgi:uncharacterized DUF497 family protein